MVLVPVLAVVFPAVFSTHLCSTLPPFTWLSSLHNPTLPTPAPPGPPSMLTVGLGGDTGAVSYQQSHCARTGHSDGYAGGAHSACAGRVWGGVALAGVGAHVTLELGGCLTLDPAQLAEQHPTGTRPTKPPPCPTALLPLLAMVLLSMDPQVGECGEAWKTHTLLKHGCRLKGLVKVWCAVYSCVENNSSVFEKALQIKRV